MLWFLQWLVGMTYWFEESKNILVSGPYSTIWPRLLDRWDHILYNYIHDMTPYYSMDMLNNENNHPSYFRFHFHMRWSHMMFFQKVPCVWAQCLNMLKQTSIILKMISCWIIIQHFHFKLLELNLNVHLYFNYIVLI